MGWEGVGWDGVEWGGVGWHGSAAVTSPPDPPSLIFLPFPLPQQKLEPNSTPVMLQCRGLWSPDRGREWSQHHLGGEG